MNEFRDYNDTRRYSRAWWFQQGKNIFWVTVVTALIWVYADLEFTEARDFTAVLHLTVDPKSNVAVLSRNDIEVGFRARGNRSSMENFEQWKKGRGDRIDVDVSSFPVGDNSVSIEEVLQRDPAFARAGLSVVPGTSSVIQFRLDTLEPAEVPVEFEHTGANLTSAVVTPAKMTIKVAKSRWEQIQQLMPSPILRTEQVNLQKLEPGKPITITAEVIPAIAGIPVEPSLHLVKVDLQLEKTIRQLELTINVGIDQPPSWLMDNTWKEYKLVRKDLLEWQKTITVTGSDQDLELLRQRKSEVVAFIVLNEEDKKPVDSWLTRKVVVRFPDDVQVKLSSEAPTVQFKLEKIR